ncbi:ABC transporter permease [Micromonospora sp. NPDC005113]
MKRKLTNVAISGSAFIGLIALWYVLTSAVSVPTYILPTPGAVFEALKAGFVDVWRDGSPLAPYGYYAPTLSTLQSTLLGFLYGAAAGLTLGILLSESAFLERIMLPYASAFQAVPKIALAPLFIIWFGFGDFSRQMMAAALVAFPLLITSLNALHSVDEERLELARSYGARRWLISLRIKIPSALPAIFTGLELGIVYALLGAIAAELVAGSDGIGARLMAQQTNNDTAGMFAMLIVSGIVGASLHFVLRLVRKRLIFWT